MQRCHTYKICSLEIYLKRALWGGGSGWGGQDGCKRRIKVFVKIIIFFIFFFFFFLGGGSGRGVGGGSGWGVRVDVNREMKFCEN